MNSFCSSWLKAALVAAALLLAAFPAGAESDGVRHINKGSEGQTLDIEEHLVSGKINIFDFYSDYCGPCVRIAPYLAKLAARNKDVVILKVDINRPEVRGIDWSSPLARQYRLDSIPHFKVYDASGKKVAEGQEGYRYVIRLMQKAGIE